jgi:penicillin amidase
MAAHLPRRPFSPPVDLTVPPETAAHWDDMVTARHLPHAIDPPEGFVASANNRPEKETPVPVGFFFSADERVKRIYTLLSGKQGVSVADLAKLQQDVRMPSAPGLCRQLVALADEGLAGDAGAAQAAAAVLEPLRSWDGRHDEQSAGALAFELMVFHFLRALHGTVDMEVFKATWDPWALLHRDLATIDRQRLSRAAASACQPAAASQRRFGNWGGMHRLKLDHPFGLVPGIGRRYRFLDAPVGGSNETVMKTSYGFSDSRHATRLGALARHISDFADPDRNWFVLLGGQDGWLGSDSFLDQLALWRGGQHIQVPLRPETARAWFPHHVRLMPAETTRAPKEAAD